MIQAPSEDSSLHTAAFSYYWYYVTTGNCDLVDFSTNQSYLNSLTNCLYANSNNNDKERKYDNCMVRLD